MISQNLFVQLFMTLSRHKTPLRKIFREIIGSIHMINVIIRARNVNIIESYMTYQDFLKGFSTRVMAISSHKTPLQKYLRNSWQRSHYERYDKNSLAMLAHLWEY